MFQRLMQRLTQRAQPADLESGDPHYRAYVGPPQYYDELAGLQFSLLFAAGLRENHNLLDVGCGSLRGGRLFIPYLESGRYHGIEPNRWLVEDGIKKELGRTAVRLKRPQFLYVEDFSAASFGVRFEYVLAQSIFSHCYPDLMTKALWEIGKVLTSEGVLLATFIEGEPEKRESGWLYPTVVRYRFEEVVQIVSEAGLEARRIDWPHPLQKWFVAGLPSATEKVVALARSLQPPYRDS